MNNAIQTVQRCLTRVFKFFAPERVAAPVTKESNIRQYGATNEQEFFAVASEYFFERPKMLKAKHPELYQSLQKLYQQDVAEIQLDVATRKKDHCPCGSGKRHKRCCLPKQ